MNGPLDELVNRLLDKADRIEDFLAYHRNQVLCPVYTSVDIRHNQHKMAIVDTNAFPGGFNNLAKRSHASASDAMSGYLAKMYPGATKLLLIAENHTRNLWYFENVRVLRDLFTAAGYKVTVGTLNPELFPKATVATATGAELTLHGVTREADCLVAGGDVQDVIILNNDLSTGAPDILDGLDQPVTPPPSMGWHRRTKSEHFRITNALAEGIGKHAGFDPWLISAEYASVQGVDFRARAGLEELAESTDRVIERVQARYDAYGITRKPSVFVKADSGTYGMGIMTASSGQELLAINSRQREKMDRGKERQKTSSVIIQEGVFTDIRTKTEVAEPVMYMVCGRVIGGFHRINAAVDDNGNLNSPGSRFEPLSFTTQLTGKPGADEMMLDETHARIYQVISEIASISTGYEWRSYREGGLEIPSY